nr:phosphoribosyltransferase family protein [uncultured Brevundimonas sp.]
MLEVWLRGIDISARLRSGAATSFHFSAENLVQYRSYADLAHTIATKGHLLPRNIDLVVGIPRSGLLAANIIALTRNLPLAEVDGFTKGHILAAGRTKRQIRSASEWTDTNVLVVDDSISSGQSMREAREKLAEVDANFTFCAIFGRSDAPNLDADVVLERVDLPRTFEWNIFHHEELARMCFDVDGVLCHDPDHDQNDDGDLYLKFLLEAEPLYTTTRVIGHIVTSRLEKYRAETEAWLNKHGIQYNTLWMLDLPTAEERRRLGAHAAFKAKVYEQTSSILFVESDALQARQIASLSGKPVLSVAEHRIVHGLDDPRTKWPAPPPPPSLSKLAYLRAKGVAKGALRAIAPRT